MYNSFSMSQRRNVSHANFSNYKNGCLHPDRVMDEHDIFYLIEGSWEVGQNGTTHVLGSGDAIILHSGQHHYGITNCANGTKTMFIHFECLPNDRFIEAAPVSQTESALIVPTVVRCRDNISIVSYFEAVISTFWSEAPNKNIKLAALMDLLLFELAANTEKVIMDPLVNEALYHIRLSHNRMLSLSEISKSLNVCSRSLTDRFKKVTGKSIHQYQVDLKLEMAYMMIKDNPMRTFREVALNFGFYDEFHFSRLFKRKYGFAPYGMKKSDQKLF